MYLGAMNARDFEWDRITYPIAWEPKLDGFRYTYVDGEGYTRNANAYESVRPFARILQEAVSLAGVHVDTEMLATNWNESSKLFKSPKNFDPERIRREGVCHVFDVFNAESLGKATYLERRQAAGFVVERCNLLALNPGLYRFELVPSGIAKNAEELTAAFEQCRAKGFEGIMAKTLNGVYTLKRSFDWLKWKPEKDITVTIVGGEHGWEQCPVCMPKAIRESRTGSKSRTKKKGLADPNCAKCKGEGWLARPDILGAFHCKMENGKDLKVGGGISDADRAKFMAELPQMIGKKIDVKVQDDQGNDIVARHPNLSRVRWDL